MSCGRCKIGPKIGPKKPSCRQNHKSACSTPSATPRKVPPRPFVHHARQTVQNDPSAVCAGAVGSKSYEDDYAKHLEKQIRYLKLENDYRRNSDKAGICGSGSFKAPEDELNDKLKTTNKEILELKEELSQKQNGLKVVAAHRDELQEKLNSINDQFTCQKAELLENMLHVKRDVDRLRLERKKLDFEAEMKRSEIARYKEDIVSFKSKTELMEEEIIALKEKYAQLNHYTSEKEEELVKVNKELFSAREQLEKSDFCMALQANMELKNQLADALADTAQMKVRVEQEEAAKQKLSEQLNTVLAETADFVAKTSQLEAQVTQIQQRRTTLDKVGADMVDELSRRQNREKDAMTKLESNEKLLLEKEAAVSKLQAELDAMEQLTREMQNTCDAHAEDNRNILEFTKLLEDEMQEVEKQKAAAEKDYEVSRKKIQEKDELIAQLRNHTVELERKLEELEAEKFKYKQEQVAKWNQMMQLTSQIQHVSQDVVDDIRGCSL